MTYVEFEKILQELKNACLSDLAFCQFVTAPQLPRGGLTVLDRNLTIMNSREESG